MGWKCTDGREQRVYVVSWGEKEKRKVGAPYYKKVLLATGALAGWGGEKVAGG